MGALKMSNRLSNIISTAVQGVPDNEQANVRALGEIYFRHLSTEDAAQLSNEQLSGALQTHYQLLKQHVNAGPLIRVFNPEVSRDGFSSDYTVVQMVVRDRPFLIDTLFMSLDRQELAMHRIWHSIVHVERNEAGQITELQDVQASNEQHLSLIYCEIERLNDDDEQQQVREALQQKLQDLDIVVGDWGKMRDKLKDIKQSLNEQTINNSPYDKAEIDAFLAWILDGNFTFLGYREYKVVHQDDELSLYSVGGSGLGLLHNEGEDKQSDSFNELPQSLKKIILTPHVLLLSKSSQTAPVHRDVYMDFLGIQRFDGQGNVIGEYRFIGLLTASAYHLTPEQIPLLRGKVKAVIERAKLPIDGYAHKRLRVILNQIPRDDLFQSSVDELYEAAMGILRLYDRKKLRLFTRVDAYQRFVSCLVYVPREKYNTKLRLKMSEILLEAFGGISLEFNTHFSEANHVRMHFHVRTLPGKIKTYDTVEVEAKLAQAARDWGDDFEQVMIAQLGEREGAKLCRRFASNLPLAYRERFSPESGVEDVARLSALSDDKPIDVCVYRRPHNAADELLLKIYGRGEPVALSRVLPILEHFGVSVMAVHPYEFSDLQDQPFWVQRYDLLLEDSESVDLSIVRPQVEDGLRRIWAGEIESDKFNDLVLTTSLDVDDVVILRALGKYMLQARVPFSLEYIQKALIDNRDIAQLLVKLFHARFNPKLENQRDEAMAQQNEAIIDALQAVKSLDEDRILRWYLILINAMVRTNFYQHDDNGKRKSYVSFKFAADKIPELPKPKPMFEIFVYSPRVEGVHLRGGKVARGGLRWSDRKEDFRTEVLGLVKAQMVKNAVIVPVGSKGGFVVKSDTDSRDAFMAEGKACYTIFISGLLDITDNLVDGKVQAPQNTVRHDEDDPYLVVAADKGTASFSDLANSISAKYNFWLGDAFASGGSAGYDHKEMGITARGAWESVKRHFRMLGKDIQQRDEITVVGIGDMSGDVFGNGMLLSRKIQLVAAFNHLHIFIDPNPDVARAHQERQRLFELPRSTWADYEASLISEGGGVFSRQDKTITITPQMKERFDIQEDALSPTELISALLKAPVDLIWNGGIGTYIKHSEETHAEVGDRANDGLRVNGNEVRAKVIGEGGNLGMTQLGRIEYALNGGRLYTDAIDNSGGVNSSDHEVNIKILLNQVIEQGEMTEPERNELLESMTDEVAELVLRQNYLQPQTIEVSAAHPEMLAEHARIIRRLEREDRLDRDIEFLPNDETIDERLGQGKGLTNPELAVMLAYSKMWLYEHLLDSSLPDNQYFSKELAAYFPSKLREHFIDAMINHRLHREIICTYLTNDLVNRMGIAFAFRAEEEMDENVANIACSYVIARDVFQANQYWAQIEHMDNKVNATLQIKLDMLVRQLLERAAFWFLRNVSSPIDVAAEISRFSPTVKTLTAKDGFFAQYFAKELSENVQPFIDAGLSAEQATAFAALVHYDVALDIVLLAEQTECDANDVAKLYFTLFNRLHGQWVLAQIQQLPNEDYWDRRAQSAQLNSFYATLRAIALKLLNQHGTLLGDEELTDWQSQHELLLARIDSMIGGLEKRQASLSTLSVLLGEISLLDSHV